MFQPFKDYIIFKYLNIKTSVSNNYRYIKSFFCDTEDVILYETNFGVKHNITNYFMVRSINYGVNFMKKMRDYFDVEVDKIQIKKKYYTGEKTFILDSDKYFKKKVTLKDIINYIDLKNDKDNKNIGNYIFIKFEIHNPSSNPICLKEFILKYKDFNEDFHNTIENIALFNGIKSDSDAEIIISFIKDGQIKSYKLPYNKIYDKHINSFYNLEQIDKSNED